MLKTLSLLAKCIAPSFLVRQDARIELAHDRAFLATKRYVETVEEGCDEKERTRLLFAMHDELRKYYALVDKEVLNAGALTGAAYTRWKNEWISSATKVLDGAVSNYSLLRRERQKLGLPDSVFEPSQGTLRNLQAFLAECSPLDSESIKEKFRTNNLPNSGFDSPYAAKPVRKSMKKSSQVSIAVGSGIAFLVALLIIAMKFPQPTDFQYTVFRIVLALAAAAFASVIPGILELNLPNWIKAGGALAVFVIVYFYSPANLVAQPNSPGAQNVKDGNASNTNGDGNTTIQVNR